MGFKPFGKKTSKGGKPTSDKKMTSGRRGC